MNNYDNEPRRRRRYSETSEEVSRFNSSDQLLLPERLQHTAYDNMDEEINPMINYELRGLVPVRLAFIATPPSHPVVRRSFEINPEEEHIERLVDNINQYRTLDMMTSARVANEVIRPSAAIDSAISIANGWDEGRLQFFMEFCKDLGHGTRLKYIYTGFTDYVGVNENGEIDPDMSLHITNVTMLSETLGNGSRKQSNVAGDTMVLVQEKFYSGEYAQDHRRRVQRRSNDRREYVLSPISVLADRLNHDTLQSLDIHGGRTTSSHSQIGMRAMSVNRGWNIPSHYLSSLINAKESTRDSYKDAYADYEENSYISTNAIKTRIAMDVLRGRDISSDPLFSLYKNETDIRSSAVLQFGMLLQYFPTISSDRVCSVFLPEEVRAARRHTRTLDSAIRAVGESKIQDAEEWDDGTMETVLATQVAQILPNLMLSELVQSVSFTVTNNIHSRLETRYAWMFGNPDRRARDRDQQHAVIFVTELPASYQETRLKALQTKVEFVLLDMISHDNVMNFNLSVQCSIIGDCHISIQLGNREERRYHMPMFIAGYASPIITSDVDYFADFSEGVNSFIDTVLDNVDDYR